MSPASQGPREARPGDFCGKLLLALDASEGRRRRRARDTTPDVIGLGLERDLAQRVVRDDPSPETFEAWLVARCDDAGPSSGPLRAVALHLLEEWRLARASPAFRAWIEQGAPSDDASDEGSPGGGVGTTSRPDSLRRKSDPSSPVIPPVSDRSPGG